MSILMASKNAINSGNYSGGNANKDEDKITKTLLSQFNNASIPERNSMSRSVLSIKH